MPPCTRGRSREAESRTAVQPPAAPGATIYHGDRAPARSWPSAAAASRWSPGIPCSTTTCSGSDQAPSARGSASCPRPAATPTTTSSASTAPFPPTAARPATSRCSGASRAPRTCASHLLSQDLIYVGGGSVVSLLGVWRAHGIDEILREAWESGIVLCGLSAGSLCWFAEAVTGFHGSPQRVEGWGCCRSATASTTSAGSERRGRLPGFLREGMLPATPPRTAPPCTSPAPS